MAKINDAYDIGAAFEAIEDELIASMIRNMKRHKVEEVTENKQWSMWQAEQLKALEQYRRANRKKFGGQFQDINEQIEALIRVARTEGNMHQELQILNAIKKGFPAKKATKGATAEFFRLNDRKLDALVNATTNDMEKAEVAVLRMADDQYRRVIYNAQVYANTGAGTYEKAVDMATKDFLSAGLNCIEYKNGARHTLADYADMAIRTASKRAYLQGEGEKRQEWGIHTVIVNKRGNPCPKCLSFCGKVLIDDVWSGGSRKDGSYPLVSKAISYGLYHPRCKDSHTTYFPGISTADDTWTKEELENIGLKNQQEARQQYAERQEKKYDRLAENSLDEENQKRYAARREEYYRRRKNKVLRDDSEYQERVRKRRAEYQKKHPTTQNTEPQFDKEALKQEIAGMDQQQASLKEQLQKVKDEEKSLTQKVYFDMSGTAEETEQLKGMSAKKKEIEAQISELNKQIWKKQEVYKNDVEKRLIEDGILQEAKFSKRMKPETVDELETTIRELHDKYGIMPKAVKYSPLEVRDATATYNWFDDTIYLSNNFNDSKEYLKKVAKSENSLVEYNKHYDIINRAKKSLEEADAVLADKSVKGFEREEARLKKTYAEIQLNETRMAVRENLTDCFTHEYGHFIHRHAETNYTIKKDAFGMRDMGGVFYARDWRYDVNKHYSARAKVAASGISRYATESPYETFAEGFLAMEKGEKIPDQIAEVIEEAKKRAGAKTVAKEAGSGIITSGARITDIFSKEAEEFAEMYYEEIRSFSTDAKKIANNLNKAESDIRKIKAYLFEDDSYFDSDTGKHRRFDPDCAIAQSWQRLMIGKDIKPHDKTLIEHELLEMKIKEENPTMEHWKAHEMAAKAYDYPKEADEYYGSLKKHNKNKK